MVLLNMGVISFSYAIGTISSVISSVDIRKAKMNIKLALLHIIRRDYKLSLPFYLRLKHSIEYEYSKDESHEGFADSLPPQEKIDMRYVIHKDTIAQSSYFKKHNKKAFISYMGPKLTKIRVEKGYEIFKEGAPAENMYFVVGRGKRKCNRDEDDSSKMEKPLIGFVLPKLLDQPYVTLYRNQSKCQI
jgi:hypothetical protein